MLEYLFHVDEFSPLYQQVQDYNGDKNDLRFQPD